jgi:ubiquinone/menaquinone biosynthesis C-methylase UbiE
MTLRSKLFAATYDRMMKKSEKAGLAAHRESLIGQAKGDVLEIGTGTGANLRFYGSDVRSLTLTEPETPMLKRLERKAAQEAPTAKVLRAPAEDLPFEDDSFDTVVSTLVFCGVTDQQRALREARRVLRPGGRLLFLEHVRSEDPKLAHKQDRMNGLNRFVVGCECNRPTYRSIEEAWFDFAHLDHTTMPKAPKFVRPLIVGSATAPDGASGNGAARSEQITR